MEFVLVRETTRLFGSYLRKIVECDPNKNLVDSLSVEKLVGTGGEAEATGIV
jgi:hypothetical protein